LLRRLLRLLLGLVCLLLRHVRCLLRALQRLLCCLLRLLHRTVPRSLCESTRNNAARWHPELRSATQQAALV
jgi:hypothetical protein